MYMMMMMMMIIMMMMMILMIFFFLCAGLIIKYMPGLGRPMGDNLFDDSATWGVPDEELPAAMLELETSFKRANVLQESGRPLLQKHDKS